METIIQVQVRSVYGNDAVYPVCEQAKRLAALIGTKTFTHRALQQIEALGFTINEVTQPKLGR